MSEQQVDALTVARPYGPLGLVVASALILVVALIISALLVAAGFLALVAAFGWQAATDHLGAAGKIEQAKIGIVGSLIAYAALSAAILVAARIRGGTQWRDIIAWQRWNAFRGAAWIWGLVVLLILYSATADTTIEHFKPGFNPITTMPEGAGWRTAFVLLAAVFAPITEELLFRGWLYTSLRAAIGLGGSILIVSVLFAVAHWEPTHLYALAVFPVGLALAYVRERTGSIKASIFVHAAYNGIGSVLLLFAR